MKTVYFDGRRGMPKAVCVGMEMDNNVEQVKFVLPKIADGQSETLYWSMDGDVDAVPLQDGLWTITDAVTQHPGRAECYIAISDGEDRLWHSELFAVRVHGLPGVEGEILRIYPTAIQAGVDAAAQAVAARDVVTVARDEAVASRDRAEAAAGRAETAADTAVLKAGAASADAQTASAMASTAVGKASEAAASASAALSSESAARASETAAAASAASAAQVAAQVSTEEAARQTAEMARSDAEDDRETAEARRAAAESERERAESIRSANEGNRQIDEAIWASAERARANAETRRESACAEAVSGAESAAASANAAAANANAAANGIKGALLARATYMLSFMQGSISSSTGSASNTNYDKRLRTVSGMWYNVAGGLTCTVPNGFRAVFYYYDYNAAGNNYTYKGPSDGWVIGEYTEAAPIGDYLRVVLAREDDTNLTPDDVTEPIIVEATVATDKTLSQAYKAADAETVGAELGGLRDELLEIRDRLDADFDLYDWRNALDAPGGNGWRPGYYSVYDGSFVEDDNARKNYCCTADILNTPFMGYDFFVVAPPAGLAMRVMVMEYDSDKIWLRTYGANANSENGVARIVPITQGHYYSFTAGGNDHSVSNCAGFTLKRYKKQPKPFEGLKVSVLGDSISALENYIPAGHVSYYSGSSYGVDGPAKMWWNIAIFGAGGTPLIVDAWSGSCVARDVRAATSGNAYLEMSDVSRCQNLHAWRHGDADHHDLIVTGENIGALRKSPWYAGEADYQVGEYLIEEDPDVVILAGGCNDYSYNAPMGTYDGHAPLDTTDTTDFRGAYANLINRIQARYPKALVICGVPFWVVRPAMTSANTRDQVNVNGIGNTYLDYQNAIRDIAALKGCPVIDLSTAGFSRYNYYDAEGGFCNDSATKPTHPNATGQQVIGLNALGQLEQMPKGYLRWLKDR